MGLNVLRIKSVYIFFPRSFWIQSFLKVEIERFTHLSRLPKSLVDLFSLKSYMTNIISMKCL